MDSRNFCENIQKIIKIQRTNEALMNNGPPNYEIKIIIKKIEEQMKIKNKK